ncbi:TylF/MycF/NovP-related O-methyltransferase [Oscillospiraceae bacterium LTW-04]|nr:TylF/MycF/NovP-related O-methyltransferase [Oscillospiraceae bacterium MB24-C1]
MEIYVWGTGCAASELIGKAIAAENVTAFVDTYAPQTGMAFFLSRPVITPEKLKDQDYDLVIVASRHSQEIMKQCQRLGLDLSRLFFLYNNYVVEDLNQNYELVKSVLPKGFLREVKNRYRVIRTDGSGDLTNGCGQMDDYIRLRTLELAAAEIEHRGVAGSVAELGVFKGGFAKCLNRVFPGRTLYLFDTFTGFDSGEAKREKKAENCSEAFVEAHKNTGEKRVLDMMPYPENVVVKKGLFPASLKGLEDTYVFVSLDVDFEDSIYNGLCYFYPRLSPGGYIFLHDYNSPQLKGVRDAVNRYESEKGIRLSAVPLCDINGTLVITV